MLVQVRPATTMMRGDASYNPRAIAVTPLAAGEELLTGTFIDDGDREGHPRRRDRPFWINPGRWF